jgi:hypothetical protein
MRTDPGVVGDNILLYTIFVTKSTPFFAAAGPRQAGGPERLVRSDDAVPPRRQRRGTGSKARLGMMPSFTHFSLQGQELSSKCGQIFDAIRNHIEIQLLTQIAPGTTHTKTQPPKVMPNLRPASFGRMTPPRGFPAIVRFGRSN